jgi:transcriptional regulator with XRE-family HTH domain
MEISGAQSRAARALLGWPQERLGAAAGVAKATVVDFERGTRRPMAQNIGAIRRALEAEGIIFLEDNGGGRGVRYKVPVPDVPPAPDVPTTEDEGEAG